MGVFACRSVLGRGPVAQCFLSWCSSAATVLREQDRTELDLTDRAATFDFILGSRPQVIVDAAARVGGIMANSA